MANIENKNDGKGLDFACKLFGKKHDSKNPRCKTCASKYANQNKACIAAIAAIAKPKPKTENESKRTKGYWDYAVGSFTDIFCNSICENPMTMNQAAAIIDPKTKLPIGPHPKCKKRLITENLAAEFDHKIYMRVYPKGHPEAGKLTPAAKMIREIETKAKAKAN
jgi:hypothetical protein